MAYNIQPSKNDEALTFEAIKRIRTYSGKELSGKLLFNQLGIKYIGASK